MPSVALALDRLYSDIELTAVLSFFLPRESETGHSTWGVVFVF